MKDVTLRWPDYRMLPYETELAVAEVRALLNPTSVTRFDDRVVVSAAAPSANARALTYFKSFDINGTSQPTTQHALERNGSSESAKRQATRYSVHGMHEYKGKFNPQVARALLNSVQVTSRSIVLDPFCGSGTTLVEAAHLGLRAVGFDINPLAVLIANAKLSALRADPEAIVTHAKTVARKRKATYAAVLGQDARTEYLREWFEPAQLARIEGLRLEIEQQAPQYREILLVLLSNLLREFSLQEPADLRIRRRSSSASDRDIREVFLEEAERLAYRVAHVHQVNGKPAARSKARLVDTRMRDAVVRGLAKGSVDAAITSPPYAMALPYIDTQRLSLVWLGLTPPSGILKLQAELVGSREFHRSAKSEWSERLDRNVDMLSAPQWEFCRFLRARVGPDDGFRRQAVPSLLYRYLVDMRETFRSVATLLKPGASFFLIVGHNHTVLSGSRVDLDTPSLLSGLAPDSGLQVAERKPLDTYQRFGLHQKNAIVTEELLRLVRSEG